MKLDAIEFAWKCVKYLDGFIYMQRDVIDEVANNRQQAPQRFTKRCTSNQTPTCYSDWLSLVLGESVAVRRASSRRQTGHQLLFAEMRLPVG